MIKTLIKSSVAILLLLSMGSCRQQESSILKMTLNADQNIAPEESYYLDDAVSIIRSRLSSFGIEDENLEIKQENNRILLSITGVDTADVEIIGRIVTATNKIGFWETYENSEVINPLVEANSRAREYNLGDEYPAFKKPATGSSGDELESLIQASDSAANTELDIFNRENPLFAILRPNVDNEGDPRQGCMIGYAHSEDTLKVRQLLNRQEVTNLLPRDLKLMWSRDPSHYDASGTMFELHAVKVSGLLYEPVLDGEYISNAYVITDRGGSNIRIGINMNAEGAHRWKRMTGENIDKCIAVTIDKKVITYPRVMSEISGGNTEISGDYSMEEARFLAAVFSSGGLEMKVKLSVSGVLVEKPK